MSEDLLRTQNRRLTRVIVKLYHESTHLSVRQRVEILDALGLDEKTIGHVLSGTASIDEDGIAHYVNAVKEIE